MLSFLSSYVICVLLLTQQLGNNSLLLEALKWKEHKRAAFMMATFLWVVPTSKGIVHPKIIFHPFTLWVQAPWRLL